MHPYVSLEITWLVMISGNEHCRALQHQHQHQHHHPGRRWPLPTVLALHAAFPRRDQSHLHQPCVHSQCHWGGGGQWLNCMYIVLYTVGCPYNIQYPALLCFSIHTLCTLHKIQIWLRKHSETRLTSSISTKTKAQLQDPGFSGYCLDIYLLEWGGGFWGSDLCYAAGHCAGLLSWSHLCSGWRQWTQHSTQLCHSLG